MEKLTDNKYEIHELLKKRWSPRAFSNKEIETDKFLRILEAARWAPSAFNEQPWIYFLGFNNDTTYKKIFESLTASNQTWAFSALVLMVCCSKKLYSIGKENKYLGYDAGQSVAHMTFQAMQEGIFVHQMAGFSIEKIINNFKLPEQYTPFTVIALGYIGNPDSLPDDLKERELAVRTRKNLNDFIFQDEFGSTHEIVKP